MIISFSGIDGSGKSTQLKLLAEFLQAQGQQVHTMHLTQWTWVYQLGEKIRQPKPSSASTTDKQHKPSSTWQATLRRQLALLDRQRFVLLSRRLAKEKKLLLCDRYFWDLGVQAYYRRDYAEPFLARYWQGCPAPAIAFWLDVSPEVAEKREGGEHVSTYYAEKRRLYAQMKPPWAVTTINVGEVGATQAEIQALASEVLAR